MNLDNYRRTEMVAIKNLETGKFTLVCEYSIETEKACSLEARHSNQMAGKDKYEIVFFTAYTKIPTLKW